MLSTVEEAGTVGPMGPGVGVRDPTDKRTDGRRFQIELSLLSS